MQAVYTGVYKVLDGAGNAVSSDRKLTSDEVREKRCDCGHGWAGGYAVFNFV